MMMSRKSRLGKGVSAALRAACPWRLVAVRIPVFCIGSPGPSRPDLRAVEFRAGGGERLGQRLDLPLGFRGTGGRRRGQRLGPQPGRLSLGELREDMSRINDGGLVKRRADQHRRLADERVKRHERVPRDLR
jgi:hypothetical protein